MKALALLGTCAIAIAAPAHAAETGVTGLWEGGIGGYPVVACFDTENFPRGSYYYRKHLVPIGLSHEAETDKWSEYSPSDEDPIDWSIAVGADGALSGKWNQGNRTLPIRLTRLEWSEDDDGGSGPCGSAQYQAARAFEPVIERKPERLGDWLYQRLSFVPPAHFADNAIDSFAYEPERPGDPAIIEILRASLPTGRPDDEFMQCMAGSTGSLGSDGYVEQSARPAFANAGFLSSQESGSTFCGGAHPNHWQAYRVFDRESGTELNLESWFLSSGFAPSEYGSILITPQLRAVVMEYWPEEQEEECREYVSTIEFWGLGLTPKGVAFLPSVAHAFTPCGETIEVPWPDLAPYLSPEGEASRARAVQN